MLVHSCKSGLVTVTALACFSVVFLSSCRQNPTLERSAITYRDSSVVDDYHGTQVSDPYRWLEDDRSDETAAWVEAQNKTTDSYLEDIPFRQQIADRLKRLYDYERTGTPTVVGDQLYFSKNDGLQDQSVLVRKPVEGGEASLVLDPNTFSDDGTSSLSGYAFDKAGGRLAYQISDAGSDWQRIKILDLQTGKDLGDELQRVKFSGLAWYGDGFFYSRYPEVANVDGAQCSDLSSANAGHQLYYHKLGEDQSGDVLVYEDAVNPQRNVYGAVSDDERWLIRSTSAGTSGNTIAVTPLPSQAENLNGLDFKQLVSDFEHDYSFIASRGNLLYFTTNVEAPTNRLVTVDMSAASPSFSTVFEPADGAVLKSVTVSGSRAYLRLLRDVSSQLLAIDLANMSSAPKGIDLPGIGTTGGVSAPDAGGDGYFGFSSFTDPGAIYRLDSSTLSTQVWAASDNGFAKDDYVTKQVRYRSKDGTEIPMFIIHKRGLDLDGERPTLLYGYGGFDISIEPQHSVMRLDLFSPILEQGGVCAVASIRGGGEFGAEWHEAGLKSSKQNVFDDFIAAAEYLQAEGYTSPKRTAIYGRSNGGLLVGACITQRPELFGAAFPAVGVLDMLRYHEFTIGWAWAGDYGRSDSTEAFNYLYAYSPLHNVRPQAYPATLITTADHDDRVVPAHSFKFAAELQRQQQGDAPVLIRIDESSGHGSGKPVAKQIDEATDVLSFMFYALGVDYTVPVN